jgi:hypothetical protein
MEHEVLDPLLSANLLYRSIRMVNLPAVLLKYQPLNPRHAVLRPFAENCNYGFRRNLWALKPLGLSIGALSIMASISAILFGQGQMDVAVSAGLLNFLVLFAWSRLIDGDWVRIAGDAYAERLLEACEAL